MDWDEPHLVPNEETQPIQSTERDGALVAAVSLWPVFRHVELRWPLALACWHASPA
jgi:hypothetical protein